MKFLFFIGFLGVINALKPLAEYQERMKKFHDTCGEDCTELLDDDKDFLEDLCMNKYIRFGYADTTDCYNDITKRFLNNKRPVKKNQKKDEVTGINYDDYGAVVEIEKIHKRKQSLSDELTSSSEENYDEESWRKKDSREELLNNINSVEKEVGAEKTLTAFKMPTTQHLKKSQNIGDLLQKHKSWLKTINPRLYVSGGAIVFQLPKLVKIGFNEVSLIPKAKGSGHIAFTQPSILRQHDPIHVNFLQHKTSCGTVTTLEKAVFICIKPLDIHIRVRPNTLDGDYEWDLVCMQIYLPSWMYGYEFCYSQNPELGVYDREENGYFRKMRLFIFDGGDYDNWKPKFIDTNDIYM